MPRKPKRPCSYPGCPNLCDGRFCEEHTKEENKRYERYDRDPAVKKDTAELGRESVTAMLQHILCVRSA